MKAKIYKPSKTAMQSGRGKISHWVLEYELETARAPEPLIGWVASGDTLNQVRLKFKSLDNAVSFAREKGIEYTVITPQDRHVKPRNYADNFRYIPPEKPQSA